VDGEFRDWTFGALPETIEYTRSGAKLRSFVALADHGDRVAVELHDREHAARSGMTAGIRRLLQIRLSARIKYLKKNLPDAKRMCLNFGRVGACEALKADIIDAATARALDADPWSIRSAPRFEEALRTVDGKLVPQATDICKVLAPALDRFRRCMTRLDGLPEPARTDIAQQLDLLVFPGFVSYTPAGRLTHFERYLKGVEKRIERCIEDPERDRARQEKIGDLWSRLLQAYPPPPDPVSETLSEFRWMLEEFRISVFAQELRTAQPVSRKRLEAQWRDCRAADDV
jgi:ATP-dependent helicase HrpA